MPPISPAKTRAAIASTISSGDNEQVLEVLGALRDQIQQLEVRQRDEIGNLRQELSQGENISGVAPPYQSALCPFALPSGLKPWPY